MPDAPDVDALKALYEALQSGNASVLKSWLAAGHPVDQRFPVKDLNCWNQTSLLIAAMWGQVELVKILIEAGADVAAVDHSGFTALIHAAMYGRLDVARFLLDVGADPKVESPVNRRTALDMARIKEAADVIALLEPLTPDDIGGPLLPLKSPVALTSVFLRSVACVALLCCTEPAYYAERALEREAKAIAREQAAPALVASSA